MIEQTATFRPIVTRTSDGIEQYFEQSKQNLTSPLRDWASPINPNKKCIIFHNFKY